MPMLLIAITVILLLATASHSLLVARRSVGGLRAAAHPSTSMLAGADNNNGDDGSRWRIWTVIDALETNGLSSYSSTSTPIFMQDVTTQVAQILRQWGENWAGQKGWNTLLNKKTLLHEAEESIVALHFLVEWLENRRSAQNENAPVTLVDCCCGKGILSMLASYLFRNDSNISGIVMFDKQKDINWNHVVAANENADQEGRPLITAWGGSNLHEVDQIVERLAEVDHNGPLALVGIHLCKHLSPSFAGVANALGAEKCPFLCLAPCCLPRIVRNLSKPNNDGRKVDTLLPVRKYESIEDRHARKEANKRREDANKRTFADVPCYLCSEIHPIRKCHLLPPGENEQLDIFQRAAQIKPCWKCGEIGHFREDCKSTQQASKPRLTLPPTFNLDVSVLQANDEESNGPFETYCHLLATAVERDNVEVFDVGLINNSAKHDNEANTMNWNRDRKSIYIVASAS